MLGVLASTVTQPIAATTSSELPSTVSVTTTVPVSETPVLLPTHMLAVHSSAATSSPGAGPSTPRKVTLFPAHSVVLAAHCANFPALPTTTFPVEYASDEEVAQGVQGLGREARTQLPLVPLSLPSPETFASLSTYLYTRRSDQLFASLLPHAPPPSLAQSKAKGEEALDMYADHLRSSISRTALLSLALRVLGLWRNTCALGVNDAQLWGVIERAWGVLVRSLGEGSEQLASSS